MNAGGVSKACKSNGSSESAMILKVSGKRVSNTLVTCPEVRDNGPKGPLIPDVIHGRKSVEESPKGASRGTYGLSASW